MLCCQFLSHVLQALFFIKIPLKLGYFAKKCKIFERWGLFLQIPKIVPPLRISGYAPGHTHTLVWRWPSKNKGTRKNRLFQWIRHSNRPTNLSTSKQTLSLTNVRSFVVAGLNQSGSEPRSFVSVAVALTTNGSLQISLQFFSCE